MRDSLSLYFRYIGISLRGQMQYKVSFVTMSIGNFVIGGLEFLAIWALFDRFKALNGWTLPEAALLYGMINTSFSINDMICRGFDSFAAMVKSGDFDRLLLRPRSTVLQLIGQEWHLSRLGRLVQGLIVLVWGMHSVGIAWTPVRLALIIGSIGGGAFLFGGVIVLQATMCFWTVESLEIVNAVSYGGVETAQYPLSIYHKWMREFFTFVIPLACVNFLPTLAILGRISGPLPWLAPCVGLVFLAVALQVWELGVRHYCSTGS